MPSLTPTPLSPAAAANSRRLNGLLAQHLVALATGPTITAEALGYVLRGMACLAYNGASASSPCTIHWAAPARARCLADTCPHGLHPAPGLHPDRCPSAGSNPPALNGQLAQALNSMMGFFSADAAAQAELAGALDALAAP